MRLSYQEKIHKALGHIGRLTMVKLLKTKKYATVGTIATQTNISFKTASKHLQVLHNAGILDTEKQGLEVYYSIKKPISPIIRAIIGFL